MYSYWNGDFWLAFAADYDIANDPDRDASDYQNWRWFDIVSYSPFKATKIRTPTPEAFDAVQDTLIELGYQWLSGGRVNFKAKHIFTNTSGQISWSSAIVRNPEDFDKSPELEVIAEVVTTVTFTEVPRETVEILGKKYDKEEVEKALSSLTTR